MEKKNEELLDLKRISALKILDSWELQEKEREKRYQVNKKTKSSKKKFLTDFKKK